MSLTDHQTDIYKSISDIVDAAWAHRDSDEERLISIARQLSSQHSTLMRATNTEIIAAILVKLHHLETDK